MSQKISVRRTIIDSWVFVPKALIGSAIGALIYVLLSAGWVTILIAHGVNILGNSGTFAAGLTFLLAVWAVWLSQMVRVSEGKASWLPRVGRSELFSWLSMLAFMPVLIFAFLAAFAVAAMLAGSILTALEIDPDSLDWSLSNWSETARTLGPAGVFVTLVMAIVMIVAPLVLLLRTVAFRVVAAREGRFVVFAPGQRTRGQAFRLLVAALPSFVLPGALAVLAVNEVSLGNPYLNQIVRFAAFLIPAAAFVGFALSVERQTRDQDHAT